MIFAQQMINTYFSGHLKEASMMAGVGLGNMTINLIVFSVADSFSSVIEALGSQASCSRNRHLCGVYLNRGRFLAVLNLIPSFVLLLNSKHFYLALGLDSEIIH